MANIYMTSGQLNFHREGAELLLLLLNNVLCEADIGTLQLSVRLFQNDYVPVCASEFDDFDLATFTGYGNVTVAIGDCAGVFQIGTNEDGLPTLYLDMQTFTQSATTTSNLIYGLYITALVAIDAEAVNLVLGSLRFANGPFAMDATGNIIKVTAEMPLECQMVPVTS